MDDKQLYASRLRQAQNDISRLNSDVKAFEKTLDPLDERNTKEEQIRLAKVMASNSAAVMSLAQLQRERTSPRSSLSSSGTFKPCPPPRRDSTLGSRDSSTSSIRREPTASPRAPTVEVARSAPALPTLPRRAPTGSALSAIRARAVSASATEFHKPWEMPSPQKMANDPATVSIRVRGKDGKVHSVERMFRAGDSVRTVLYEYLRQCPPHAGTDLSAIQIFVPLTPPIPYAVMDKLTLKEAKMCPSCTIIVQM